ncbi:MULTISPECIES: DUF5592 family protein [unclassified Romboutsia]|nr:DUF5592 family protein [Romboutsia sp. 1001285H_161024_C4]
MKGNYKMIFIIPKEIASENKLWKSIYIKDFVAIIGTLFFAWITSASIYKGLVLFYYIFLLSICIILISKSTKNPNKRVWQSVAILFMRSNRTYHSVNFEVRDNVQE